MVDNLFTDSLEKYREDLLSNYIKDDLKSLRKYFIDQEVKVFDTGNQVGLIISFDLKVNIPLRGTVNGIPINSIEPIFILLNKSRYPFDAPWAFSNRKNFPSSNLPHLNPVPKGAPASFCLHRGNMDDWFAEHTIIDFVERIQSWLNDAAANKLIREKDEFEITRISQPFGYTIFSEVKFIDHLNILYKGNQNQNGFSLCWYELLNDSKNDPLIKKDSFVVKNVNFVSDNDLSKIKEVFKDFNKHTNETNAFKKQLLGLYCFPNRNKIYSEYFSEIPDKLCDFLTWTDSLEIPVRKALEYYLLNDLQFIGGIPISIVIPRPTKVIRHSTNIEILNFVICAGGDNWPKDGKYNDNTSVYLIDHKKPVTQEYARDLSSFNKDLSIGRTLMLGCGALGSKISLHLIRSGQIDFTFLDNDDLSPHNIIRHGLLSNSLGLNKAEALKKEVEKIYHVESQLTVEAIKESAIDILSKKDNGSFLKPFKVFVDASASSNILNLVSRLQFSTEMKYYRCELSNRGNFGFLFSEGKDRNPRIDDLQMSVYDLSLEREDISKWLQLNKKEQESLTSNNEEIMVGMSCSSDTTKVSDEIISFHSSVISSGIRSLTLKERDNGLIQLSKYSPDNSESIFNVEQLEIKPFDIIKMRNDSDWMIRMKSGLKEEMFSSLKKDFPNETGGLLLGRINPKTKVAHITRVLPAPPDSKKLPYLFVRGKVGVPLAIRKHRSVSGGLIDFVGEWHTHPNASTQMSSTDLNAVNELRKYLDPIPYPTIVLIITPNKVCPYIYGPK